jgi:hypothetical protein
MKNSFSAGRFVILLVAALNLATVAAVYAGPGADYTRSELMGNSGLSIFREADYGNHNGLSIYIDGIPITTLSRGEGYKAIVRPGRHLLTVVNTPSPYGKTRRTHKTIHFAPGQNYSFTAIWDVDTVLLEDGGYRYRGF